MNRQHPVEPYWQDENDWLCTVEFLPSDDREGRLFAADLVGYLCGYAQLTNARVLASSVILRRARTISFFPLSSPEEKKSSSELGPSNGTWERLNQGVCRPLLKRLGMLVDWQRSYPEGCEMCQFQTTALALPRESPRYSDRSGPG
jgi:hypothetical protein